MSFSMPLLHIKQGVPLSALAGPLGFMNPWYLACCQTLDVTIPSHIVCAQSSPVSVWHRLYRLDLAQTNYAYQAIMVLSLHIM